MPQLAEGEIMKKILIGLTLAALACTVSAAGTYTSTGFSYTTGSSITNTDRDDHTHTKGRGYSYSTQALDNGTTTRTERYTTHLDTYGGGDELTLGSFSNVSSTTTLGSISVREGSTLGTSSSYGNYYSESSKDVNGKYTESTWVDSGNYNYESGNFHSYDNSYSDTSTIKNTVYGTSYTDVNFNY